jgi:atypical dual specificity phosphatase
MLEFAYARLSESLLAGRMPYAGEHVHRLAADGVTDVVNLCRDAEYWEGEREAVELGYRETGIVEHRLAVSDGGTVPVAILDRSAAIAGRGVVYVHCRGGRERSAAVSVGLLALARGLPADEALELARSRWPVFQPLDWQLAAVRAWVAAQTGPHADRSRV